MEIDGIRYIKLEGEEYYLQEIFDSEELIAYFEKNAIAIENSVFDYIIYDSETVELPFAKALDTDPDVRMFLRYLLSSKLRLLSEHIILIGLCIWIKMGWKNFILLLKQKARHGLATSVAMN